MEKGRSAGVLDCNTAKVFRVAINENSNLAATYSRSIGFDPTIKIWSVGDDKVQCKATLNVPENLYALCCHQNWLLSASKEGPIKVWDISGSAPVALMDLPLSCTPFNIVASESHGYVLYGGRLLLDDSTSLALSDFRTGKPVRLMNGHKDTAFSISADSNFVTAVSGSWDKTVKLWDLGSGKCIDTFQHDQPLTYVHMHESGSIICSLDAKRCLRFFAVSDGMHGEVRSAVDLEAVCDVESAPGDISKTTSGFKMAVKRDMSCVAARFNTNISTVKTMLWS